MRVDVRAEKCELRIEKSSEYIIPGPSLCGILSPKDFRGLRVLPTNLGFQVGPLHRIAWPGSCLEGIVCFLWDLGFLFCLLACAKHAWDTPHRGWWHPAAEGAQQHRLLLAAEALWQLESSQLDSGAVQAVF